MSCPKMPIKFPFMSLNETLQSDEAISTYCLSPFLQKVIELTESECD